MSRHRLEVADVFRAQAAACLAAWGKTASPGQRKALRDICLCRTAALGGHALECDKCGHQENSYNSCRNRHCPKCQAQARTQWLGQRAQELLGTPYFHVVFTLPRQLAPLALQNPKLVYGMLFRAASRALCEIARDPKHLGAQIGFLAVLHTWGQKLGHHPHVHCLVPGGGLSPDGSRWVSCRKGFFLPVQVLSCRFRNLFLQLLGKACRQGKLSFHGKLSHLARQSRWDEFLKPLKRRRWVVYAKRPFGSPEHVLKYLARYANRVAISNQRLTSFKNGRVTFRYKDYSKGCQQKALSLDGAEFIRRFLLHILPKGFVRIRHYGFLANCNRKKMLPLCRQLLGQAAPPRTEPQQTSPEPGQPRPCPSCKDGFLLPVATLQADPGAEREFLRKLDSS